MTVYLLSKSSRNLAACAMFRTSPVTVHSRRPAAIGRNLRVRQVLDDDLHFKAPRQVGAFDSLAPASKTPARHRAPATRTRIAPDVARPSGASMQTGSALARRAGAGAASGSGGGSGAVLLQPIK